MSPLHRLAFMLLLVHGAAPAQPAAPYTVYAAGDIARCLLDNPHWSFAAGTARLVAGRLAGDPDAAVLTLGDNAYPDGTAHDFATCYAPTWGRFRDRTWPSPGNHDYYTPGAAAYFAYFGERAGPGYYSVELGSWHVISLDSLLQGDAMAAQLAWLRTDLATHSARCTLAYWHQPLYSSGGHGSDPTMRDAWELLYQAGAEIVLSGHDHDYERFAPQDASGRLDRARGIRQFVVGTGGDFPTYFTWPAPHSEVRDNSRTGVLRLRLLDGAYEWQFLEDWRNGLPGPAQPDSGAGQCH